MDSRGSEAVLGIFNLFDARITQEAYEYTGNFLTVSYAQRLKPLSITSRWRKSAWPEQTAQGDRDKNGTYKGLLEETRHIHTHPVLHHPGEPSSLTQERIDRRRRRFFTATTRVQPPSATPSATPCNNKSFARANSYQPVPKQPQRRPRLTGSRSL
jgi:hypothetical protein